MRIYKLKSDVENYEWLTLVNEEDWRMMNHLFNGQPAAEKYRSIQVIKMNDQDRDRPLSDCPYLMPGISILNQKAIDKIWHLFSPYSELLPLSSYEGKFYIVHVTNILDCIDYQKSIFKRFKNSPESQIMRFIKYAFHSDKVGSNLIFKIIDQPKSTVFVTQEFVNYVNSTDITGLKFDLVWDSEEDKVN
ncbi:imm11 family protein [Desulfosporosinus sp. SYSU MS00001]|uniref:imm11 family protein n=1 Tax=Desulfosporosinus sp. SYSU MS00001 TaxID=3416284 RepID=UPI003CEA6514